MLKFIEDFENKIFSDEFLSKDGEVIALIRNFYLNY